MPVETTRARPLSRGPASSAHHPAPRGPKLAGASAHGLILLGMFSINEASDCILGVDGTAAAPPAPAAPAGHGRAAPPKPLPSPPTVLIANNVIWFEASPEQARLAETPAARHPRPAPPPPSPLPPRPRPPPPAPLPPPPPAPPPPPPPPPAAPLHPCLLLPLLPRAVVEPAAPPPPPLPPTPSSTVGSGGTLCSSSSRGPPTSSSTTRSWR